MKKRIATLLTAILAVTALFNVMIPGTLAEEAGLCLTIMAGKDETKIVWDELTLVPVRGETINGRGEVKEIDAEGVALRDVLDMTGIEAPEKITVVARDMYQAEVSVDELNEEGKVYLIRSEDELRLIVFGDKDSKRTVRDVVRVVLE